MKFMKTTVAGAALALSLVGASSASAANWDPQNTAVTATQEGAGKLTVASGLSISCASSDLSLSASANIAMASSGISFSSCLDPLGSALSFTTFGTWNFVATDTTNVDIQVLGPGAGGTGSVITIHMPTLGCDIHIPGPINIPNNDWNNSSHTLHVNSTFMFPIVATTESCHTLVGTTATLDANYVVGGGAQDVTIT